MDLVGHLRQFLVVAEELHFGRAAERLGIAQPPLSQRIRRLERELGVELFDRSGRQVRLTAAGELLRQESADLLGRVDRLLLVLDKAKRGEFGALRAGVPPETPASTLAALLTRFRAEHPEVRLDLQEIATPEQVRLLADRQLDVGLLAHPVDSTDLVLGPLIRVRPGVLLPRRSPLARKPELALSELSGHGLVLFPRAEAPGRYDAVLHACRSAGFTPTAVHHARNPEFAMGLVLAEHGVAFELASRDPRVVWRPLVDDLVWTSSAAWPESSPHPAAVHFGHIAAEVFGAGEHTEAPVPGNERPWAVVFPSHHRERR